MLLRLLAAAAACTFVLAGSAVGAQPASPGDDGIGDPLYPQLGNGGYDAEHYTLELRYPTGAPTETVTGTVVMRAKATQALSRFNLDFGGGSVGGVEVDRRDAAFERDGQELVITPRKPIRKGRTFVVKVEDFTATPTVPTFDDPTSPAFFAAPSGSGMAAQPDLAHLAYPSNDHPRDKARYTFRLDVPEGLTAVASGELKDSSTRGGRTHWTYVMRQPLASELTQIAVGAWDLIDRGRHQGVHVRDLTAPPLTSDVSPKLATELDHLRWMRDRVGRYPFGTYGSFVIDAEIGFALETQTLSVFDFPWFEEPQGLWEPTMVHELAHQWFGDDVAPYEWSDLWLNEGHATWYELLFADERGFIEDDTGAPVETFDELMELLYGLGDQFRQDFGPVAQPLSGDYADLFSPQAYYGGALALYALRQEIGADTFERLERRWVRRFSGESVSTRDFIAFASDVAGRDLTAFLEAWLYGTQTPEMPGHPDWTVDAPAAAARRTSAAARAWYASPRHRPTR